MTQLMITIEDPGLVPDIKKALKLLRGVKSISVYKSDTKTVNKKTLRAIQDAREGKTIRCDSFDDYLEKVKG
jgi:hypothetical protein